MKKSIRNLIIMVAVLVVLGGGAAALILTQPASEDDTSSSSTVSIQSDPVIDREESEIASVLVENPQTSFTLLPLGSDTTTSSEEDEDSSDSESSESEEDVEFTIDGYQGFNLKTSDVTSAAKTTVSINAMKELGEQDDLAEYGLSGETATNVEVHYKDGSTDTYVVGSEAGESAGRYLLKDGVVYISASFSEDLLGTPLDFIDTDLYTVADRVEETVDSEGSSSTTTLSDILYRIEFSGSNFSQPITIEYDDSKISSYLITSPITAESGSNTFSEILTALKSLSVSSVVATGRTQENLEQYGLAEPYAQITYDMNGEEHTVAVSAADSSGNRYLVADDNDVIYQVSNDTVTSWADATLMELRMSYVWLPNIKDVSAVTFTVADGTQYRFDVEQVLNEEDSTEDDPSYDLEITNGDGQAVDYENYQDLYQLVLSQSVLSTDPVEYDANSFALQVTYEYFDGSEDDVITYCQVPGQDERYAALLNGEFNGLVRRSEISNVLEKIPMTYNNEAIE